MNKKNKIILIGAIREGKVPNCGETMKNQLFIKRYKELFDEVKTIDTLNWQNRPWIILKVLFMLIFNQDASIVLSASTSVRYLINFLYYIPIHKKVYFWVVGEGLSKAIDNGMYKIEALNKMKKILIQGQSMVQELKQKNVHNVCYIPNSKPIIFHPIIKQKSNGQFRFVFLSRIHPDKGVREIISASNLLMAKGYKNFIIDFYGNIEAKFKDEFLTLIAENNSIEYKGFLNLLTEGAYKELSQYDIMLFPTYWAGEAFPGVVIDANIAGVPIIASDWNQNKYVVRHRKTGIIIPPHNVDAIVTEMENFILGRYDLFEMKNNCNEYIQQYDYKKVLSRELFKQLGMLK